MLVHMQSDPIAGGERIYRMNMVRDMVWAVLLGRSLPTQAIQPDRVTVECNVSGIWLHDVQGSTLAAIWFENWWGPVTLGTVESIAERLALQLEQNATGSGRIEP